MTLNRKNWPFIGALLVFILAVGSFGSVTAAQPAHQVSGMIPAVVWSKTDGAVVARVYYRDAADLDQLTNRLDVWEVNHVERYLLVMLNPDDYTALKTAGYYLEVDAGKTAQLGRDSAPLAGQTAGIPGYPCYRTVEETYAAMDTLTAQYPNLVSKVDIGDSWDKVTPGGPPGYDLFVLVVTNKSRPAVGKAKFFLMAEIHARELTTAETAMRYAEYLAANYGKDPDITWMLDYNEVHILVMTNPDGRKFAEQGFYWRKNTNDSNLCIYVNEYGIDLNRNSAFHWGGADSDPCGETYQGPQAGSEPETQAMQAYVASIFTGQRGPLDSDSAPTDTTGMFITLHSYADVDIFPWGWTNTPSPNYTQLNTLGNKLGFFNHYKVCQSDSNCMYQTTGTSDDWAYGTLGVAAFTVEMGTAFFEDCSTFTTTIWPENRDMLVYVVKAARQPYLNPGGPDATSLELTASPVWPGALVSLTGKADDTRYFSGGQDDVPHSAIAGARYSIDNPSWAPGAVTYPMTPSDSAFTSPVEDIQATVDTTGLSTGRHILFIEAETAPDQWGSPTAIFLDVGYTFHFPAIDKWQRPV